MDRHVPVVRPRLKHHMEPQSPAWDGLDSKGVALLPARPLGDVLRPDPHRQIGDVCIHLLFSQSPMFAVPYDAHMSAAPYCPFQS